MDWIVAHYDELLAIIGGVVSVATVIVALTSSTKDDEVLGKIITFLEKFSIVSKK